MHGIMTGCTLRLPVGEAQDFVSWVSSPRSGPTMGGGRELVREKGGATSNVVRRMMELLLLQSACCVLSWMVVHLSSDVVLSIRSSSRVYLLTCGTRGKARFSNEYSG